jgi:hypothetical protein
MLSACGSSNSNGVTTDKACSDIAQARCDKRMACTSGAGITRTYGDMATCLAREKLSCMIGLDAPMTGNTPSTTEACVAAFASYSCTDFLLNNPPVACIPTGPKPSGGTCAFAGQCASTYCSNNKTTVCGTCGTAPPVGSSCVSTSCARGQECVGLTNLCVIPGTSGAACNAQNPCAPDLGCVGATSTTMGTCMMASQTAGTACGTGLAPCDNTMGLYCGGPAGSKTCMTQTYVGDAQPCGTVSAGTIVGCAKSGSCYTAGALAQPGEAGTCKAAAADGAACDIASGPPCLFPARCVVSTSSTAGTCTVPDGSMCM